VTPVATAKKRGKFDSKKFLSTIDGGRKIVAFPKKQTIFVQGDPSDAVFYIQTGKVRLAVVSKAGKEATIGILNEGDFFGEGCLTGQPQQDLDTRMAQNSCRRGYLGWRPCNYRTCGFSLNTQTFLLKSKTTRNWRLRGL
jgi:CRP-like cAMP-binding protein